MLFRSQHLFCFHTRWCDGKSRGEAEKVLRHTARAAFLVRGLTKHRSLWKSDVFYFALKKHCLSYMEQFTDWLDSDVYGGDALSEERLLGVAHHQFNIDAQRPPVSHLDILPPVPLDKRTMKPFKRYSTLRRETTLKASLCYWIRIRS